MIPKILHHVWPGTDEFPAERTFQNGDAALFHAWRESWLRHHPDWSMMFHRLGPVLDSRVQQVLDRTDLSPVVKSDLLRWAVLAWYGGVYVDTDFECLAPFDRLLDDARGAFCAPEPYPWVETPDGLRPMGGPDRGQGTVKAQMLSPALVGAEPGHPFVHLMVERLLSQIRDVSAERLNHDPHIHTGPLQMTETWNAVEAAGAAVTRSITVHPVSHFYRELAEVTCELKRVPFRNGIVDGFVYETVSSTNVERFATHYWSGSTTREGWVNTMRAGPGSPSRFSEWYKSEHGSGPGSTERYTRDFRAWLAVVMRENNVRSVLDYGCGDWTWAKLMDWTGIEYQGVEVVPELVERLIHDHARENVRFEAIDAKLWKPKRSYDLVICKDVLQHLPNDDVQSITDKLVSCARDCLFINDWRPSGSADGHLVNTACELGGYRPIDLSKPPFSMSGYVVFDFFPAARIGAGYAKVVNWRDDEFSIVESNLIEQQHRDLKRAYRVAGCYHQVVHGFRPAEAAER